MCTQTCRDPWPRTRARRQGTAAVLTSESGGYRIGDGEDPYTGSGPTHGLLTVEGSGVSVGTIRQGNVCVTVKAFLHAPPLRLKGWTEVAEVGVTSRSGRLVVPSAQPGGMDGAARPLPNLAIEGPGRYRVRVYARAGDDSPTILPTERHLVVVHPGRSRKAIVHRSGD